MRKGYITFLLFCFCLLICTGCNSYQHGKSDIEYELKYELNSWDENVHLNRDFTVVNSVEELDAVWSSKAEYSSDFFIDKALIFIRFRYSSTDMRDSEFGIKLCCLRVDPFDGTLAKVVFDIKGTKNGGYDQDINTKIFVLEIDKKNLSETEEIEIAVHNLNSKKYGGAYYPLESKS